MGSWFRTLLIFQVIVIGLATSHTASARTWQVVLADGSGTKLSVAGNSEAVEFHDERSTVLSIPAASINEILHSTQHFRRSTKAFNLFENNCCAGTGSHALSVLAMAIAAPMGSAKTHYVEIYWHEGTDRSVTLELAKDEYQPFMDWLQQLSGTKWRDVEREREQVMKSIEHQTAAAFRVPIRYSQGFTYNYSVVPLDDNDKTQLYFFEGEVKPKNLVAILPVTRTWSMNICVSDAEVLYGACHDESCDVDAIMLPTVTYRPTKSGASTFSQPTSVSDGSCRELAEQKRERAEQERARDEDSNRPALKRKEHRSPD